MTCAQCAALAQDMADLKAEVDEWRAHDAGDRTMARESERIIALRQHLPILRGAARALLRLADASGRSVSFAALVRFVGQSDDVDVDNMAKQYICQGRAALKAAGMTCETTSIRQYGYRMDPVSAEALKALAGDGAP